MVLDSVGYAVTQSLLQEQGRHFQAWFACVEFELIAQLVEKALRECTGGSLEGVPLVRRTVVHHGGALGSR